MTKKRRKRSSLWRILFLLILIAGFIYLNRVVVPATPPLFIDTPTPTRNPESYTNEAKAYYEDGKLLQAIDAYKQAIQAQPEDASLYIELARVQIFAGHYEDAQESAELGLLMNPDNPMGYAMRAWALDFQGDLLNAEASIKRALELDSNNAVAHAIYAEILIDKGDYDFIDDAIQESRTAESLDPDSLEVHRARGYVLYWTSNYEEAIKEYKVALSINGKIPNLYLMLGYCYYAVNEYDQAVESFNQANALNPSDPTPDYEISRVYFTEGEYSRAAEYAEEAVKDDPTNPRFHGNLGVALAKAGSPNDAIDELALAIKGGVTSDGKIVKGTPLDYNVRTIEFYSTYGLTLARQNRCNEAVPIFQAMLSVVPNDDLATYNAQEGLKLCQENLDATPSPEESTPTP
ncbi:MAG TPA: tetratricopeptide repeat protein [Anaerolineae bacterium]|nr:tetratricopeptide repeat protein [Anaerolineae bacterium]